MGRLVADVGRWLVKKRRTSDEDEDGLGNCPKEKKKGRAEVAVGACSLCSPLLSLFPHVFVCLLLLRRHDACLPRSRTSPLAPYPLYFFFFLFHPFNFLFPPQVLVPFFPCLLSFFVAYFYSAAHSSLSLSLTHLSLSLHFSFVVALCLVFFAIIISNDVCNLACLALGGIYPAFESLKALVEENAGAQRRWLAYWAIMSVFIIPDALYSKRAARGKTPG